MTRREWLRAMRSELGETHGMVRVRWVLGLAWVAALGAVPALVAAGVVLGVVGGTVGNHERFVEVYRSGSTSWIGALALTVPTALTGLAAALLVLRRHRAALAAAYTFAGLVVISAAIAAADVAPVRPFLRDWERVAGDPRAAHHADELRFNSAIGALVAAAALVLVARSRRPRTGT